MPGGPDPWGGCWPGPDNTGVPDDVNLRPYNGSCTLVAGDFRSREFNCDLTITGLVSITDSRVNGAITVLAAPAHLTITDSFVDASPDGVRARTGINANSSGGATITRVEIIGGNRSVMCDPCTMVDSFVHGQEIRSPWHASSVRSSQNSTLVHNVLWCEPPKAPPHGGCSANLTGYPDFKPTMNWDIRRNLVMSGEGLSFCAFGGNSNGKQFSDHPDNATNIRFVDNVFRRDALNNQGYPDCGLNGNDTLSAAIVAFETKPGNVWRGNVWADDGSLIPPRG